MTLRLVLCLRFLSILVRFPLQEQKMVKKWIEIIFILELSYILYTLCYLFYQVNVILQTLQLQESAKHKGHFALYNCLVLGHTKNKGVQRIYCNPFPAKPFYGSHRLDLVMIRPPGIDRGAFVVSPSTVSWYARVLLLCYNRHCP